MANFPFDYWRVNVFLIEAGHENVHRIDILMFTNGYRKVALLGKDHVYAHQEFLQIMSFNFLSGKSDMNPYDLVYPPYINIDPYNDTFQVFQRRFLDPKFGE